MLSVLHIENIAVIERADIELSSGLTVLTGETGAGKSIIIDSLGAILGQRTSRELVRAGASRGFVSACFTDIAPELTEKLREYELEGEESGTVYIQRQLSAEGKNTCRVNMKPVSAAVLRELAPYLLNIHGQHDGQQLMDEHCHIDFLDRFAEAETLLDEYTPMYRELLSLKKQITALERSESERLQRIDMLEFHLEEIESAALQVGEEEELNVRKTIFDNAGRLVSALERAYAALDQEESSACTLLADASHALSEIAGVSPALGSLSERAAELRYLAEDLRSEIIAQKEQVDFSREEQTAVEERLDLIYRLKQKYGASVEEILAYAGQARAELQTLQDADETRETLRVRYRELLAQARAKAGELSKLRMEAAKRLEARIVSELADLDMARVQLAVRVESGTRLAANGVDTVAFLISVNPGEALKPLAKVASGGELSRVMLAMKNVLTEQESVGTLVFDEIDTGVSGRAAQRIAHKLSAIGGKKQTLCVTHLPQIAAMGDHHLLISKSVEGDRTYTSVTPLTGEAREAEVARMLAGDEITDTTLRNARELLVRAVERTT